MSSIIQNKFHDILGDAARLTKFNFILPPVTGGAEWMNHLIYSVKALTLPTMEHTPINFMHKGLTIPIRGTTKFNQAFTVTFYLSETHILKRFFEEWMMLIEQRHYYYNPRTQARYQRQVSGIGEDGLPPYLTWYNTTAYIEQYDFDGMKPTAIYEIFNVFPTRVDAPQYSYDSVGQIAEFTVTFTCTHFKLHSKGLKSGMLQNQLYHTTNRWSLLGELAQRGDSMPYVRAEGEYWFDEGRFREFNSFLSDQSTTLDQTPDRKQEVYWRPYELARWNNMWNRWREINEGANTNAANDRKLRDFDHDEFEETKGDIYTKLQKAYKPIDGDFGYNGDTKA